MNKSLKLVLLFGGTLILWGAGLVLFFGMIFKMVKENEAIATFEAPGAAKFSLVEPGAITIWHDYQTIFDGTTVRNEQALPSGFRFEITTGTGEELGAIKMSRATTTMTAGTVAKVAIGTMELTQPGDYQIKVTGPDAEPRIVSVSKGVFKDMFVNMLSGIGLIFVLGLLGLITLIFGIVTALSKNPPLN